MNRMLAAALVVLVGGGVAFAGDLTAPPALGVIKAPGFDKAKELALKEVHNPALLKSAEALWDPAKEMTLLDRVAETLAIACPDAKKVVELARDSSRPAPTEVPAVIKNQKCSAFFRNNLGLYFAKEVATRRVHEEALETLKAVTPEQSVDPASYYFFRAVAEHKLQMKEEGLLSVNRLLNNVADAPERYTTVATLMKEEMVRWKGKDLGYIARAMDDLARRFDLARGGDLNIAKQGEVIALLDQMIKELEKQCGA